ncbi:MAG: DNA polymerase IV [Firmicutes bacterium]|nr:DNA polymerase IV [Bacillota bacterium]
MARGQARGRGGRPEWATAFGDRTVVHVDMDAFFAQVEVMDNPAYRGLPLIVGGKRDSPRGVVATCSYEARAFGVRSAMPIRQAVKLCPQAVFVQPRMARYEEVSRRIREVLFSFSPTVEPISIDEAFLDMTGCEHPYRDAQEIGRRLKQRIRKATGLIASVGIAPNKFVAKLASDQGKPDGLMVVSAREMDRFLLPLPITAVWGVGPKTAARLMRAGMRTVADVRSRPVESLCRLLGETVGRHVYELCLGQDRRPVQQPDNAKSIGRETTFSEDIADGPELRAHLARLCADVGARLRRSGMTARTVTLKIRFPNFETHTRSRTAAVPFRDDERLFTEANQLLDSLEAGPLRLLGVYVSHLAPDRQTSLFPQRAERLAEVMDAIRQRYGPGAIHWGREISSRTTTGRS